VYAPETDGWKSKGYFEIDFLGYHPDPSIDGPTEASFFSNPTLRVRHAYMTAEKNGWKFIAGQTWSLFGWQPDYVLASISVNPVTGTLYQRTQKVGAMKNFSLNSSQVLQAAAALERPTQRDGRIPNLEAGVRWLEQDRASGFNGPNSDIKNQPLSIGLSGTYRNFSEPDVTSGSTDTQLNLPSYAFAVDTLIPILASSEKGQVSNTLTLTGEFTMGKGYGDEMVGFTGGQHETLAVNTTPGSNIDLDHGLGGYVNSAGTFELLDLRTWNAELQYHPDEKMFVTLGYGQLWSSNISDFVGAPVKTDAGMSTYAASALYDRSEVKFMNVGYDCTSSLRVAGEFSQFTTQYVDGMATHDNRYMLASYFRF
jgi:hypothetical protein